MASETAISREIATFLRDLGCKVYVTSRRDPKGRRTTAGLPDMLVLFPEGERSDVVERRDGYTRVLYRQQPRWTFAEIKGPKGKLRPDQIEFLDHAVRAGVPWQLWRSVDDAVAWAKRTGIVE